MIIFFFVTHFSISTQDKRFLKKNVNNRRVHLKMIVIEIFLFVIFLLKTLSLKML